MPNTWNLLISGGYHDFRHWHAEGWDWVNTNKVQKHLLYWHNIDDEWHNYTYHGLQPLNLCMILFAHISYFEAYAYASWKGLRLPTEFEWEAAATKFSWGKALGMDRKFIPALSWFREGAGRNRRV
jgi:hypothetical protein